jgi:hypothetical protein
MARRGARLALRQERLHHMHRLGGGRRLVQQRGIRDLESGQIAHHRLEVQEGFEATLRDLGLVRRVRRVPTGVLQDVSLDDRRRDAIGVTHAEIAPPNLVLGGDRVQLLEEGMLRFGRGQVEGLRDADRRRNRLVDQLVERAGSDLPEHHFDVRVVGTNVARYEGVGVLEGTWHWVTPVCTAAPPPLPVGRARCGVLALR